MSTTNPSQLSLLGYESGAWTDRGAVISEDGHYRYHLWRRAPGAKNRCLFVLLNPSTADALEDDPTLRRCIGYAFAWGHDGVDVANPFAWRATQPETLLTVDDPVGPLNHAHLTILAAECSRIVVGWGDGPKGSMKSERGQRWRELFKLETSAALRRFGHRGLCFGWTRAGRPKHPLYLRADAALHVCVP